ncbi:MAG: hypothetical protein ACM3X7_02505 [Solirubrobacterales bacterium]
MKKGDILWGLGIALIAAILIVPASHAVFVVFTTQHPYMAGFVKFFILATMGELLAIRIITSNWTVPKGWFYRALIWGFLGMAIVLTFGIFSGGVAAATNQGLLPGKGVKFLGAFFTSAIMNLSFGPAMMCFHRFTDTFIDMKYEGEQNINILKLVRRIDWNGFYSFVVLKTIPFFWIPAHTAVFLLPAEYRVIAAAFLSVALGGILAFAKKKPQKN